MKIAAFDKQFVLDVPAEPVDVATGGGFVFIAGLDQQVRVYSHDTGVECHRFKAILPNIVNILYSSTGDCIITLEKVSPTANTIVARAYYNWRVGSLAEIGETPEVVDKKTCTPDVLASNRFVAYQLPLSSTVNTITACPETGTLAISMRRVVSLWRFSQTELPRLIVELNAAWIVTRLSLYRGVLGYASASEVRIMFLDFNDASEGDSAPVNASDGRARDGGESVIETDGYYVECQFDENGTSFFPANSGVLLNVPSVVPQGRGDNVKPFVIYGPLTDPDRGVRANTLAKYELTSCALILQRRFPADVLIHSIHLVPDRDDPAARLTSTRPGTPPSGVLCIIATARKAYLYDLVHPSLLCSYEFESPTTSVCVDPYFLYAVSPNTLRFHTLRSARTAQQAAGLPQPRLLTEHYFFGLERMITAGSHFVLQCKLKGEDGAGGDGDDSTAWNVYLLRPSTIDDICSTIVDEVAALEYVQPDTFYALTLESHLLLQRAHAQLLANTLPNKGGRTRARSSGDGSHTPTSTSSFHSDKDSAASQASTGSFTDLAGTEDPAASLAAIVELKNYRTLLRTSSSRLCEIHLTRREFPQATDYCIESDMTVQDALRAYRQAAQEGGDESESLPASDDWQLEFCRYLENVLFDSRHPATIVSDGQSDEMVTKVHNELLEIVAKYSPDLLGELLLDSALQEYTIQHALKLLNTTWTTHFGRQAKGLAQRTSEFAYYVVMRVLLFLELGQISEALDILSALDPVILYEIITDRRHLLIPPELDVHPPHIHADRAMASPLAKVLQPVLDADPSTLPDRDSDTDVDVRPMLAHLLLVYSPKLLRYILQSWDISDPRTVVYLLTRAPGVLDTETPFAPLSSDIASERLLCLEDLLEQEKERGIALSDEFILILSALYLEVLAASTASSKPTSRRPTLEEEGDDSDASPLPSLFPVLDTAEGDSEFVNQVATDESDPVVVPGVGGGEEGGDTEGQSPWLLEPLPWLDTIPSLLHWSIDDNNIFGRERDLGKVKTHCVALKKLHAILSYAAIRSQQKDGEGISARCSDALSELFKAAALDSDIGLSVCILVHAILQQHETAIDTLLASGHIEASYHYAVQFITDIETWKYYTSALSRMIQSSSQDTSVDGPTIDPLLARQIYRNLFMHLSHALSPEVFVTVLPADGTTDFFVPFITRCLHYHKGAFVQQGIVHDAQRCDVK